ncbi:MAG: hypothetical protein ABI417_08340 [Coleofasciculaceae cyanobacterium]
MFSFSKKSLGFIVISALIAAPVAAHNVKVSGDVAATFHLEPGHNPKAGQSSRAWFALTRRGGAIIPLSQCNCQLAVYPEPHKEGSAPLMKPTLKAISAEQYQGIPGAEIVFPRAGSYELELTGTAKNGANFRPFSLSYTVNVGS